MKGEGVEEDDDMMSLSFWSNDVLRCLNRFLSLLVQMLDAVVRVSDENFLIGMV